jgi:predicted HicB family RNase H-like nuclease
MAKRTMPKAPAAEIKSKPVRVDLDPAVHKALRKKAADQEVSMALLARTIITRELGFKTQ